MKHILQFLSKYSSTQQKSKKDNRLGYLLLANHIRITTTLKSNFRGYTR